MSFDDFFEKDCCLQPFRCKSFIMMQVVTLIPLKFPTAFWLYANRLFTAPSEIRASLNEFCVVEQYDKLVGRNFVEIKHRAARLNTKSL
jgi:hypothetical protein